MCGPPFLLIPYREAIPQHRIVKPEYGQKI
jgi:hypothetical protein